MIGVPKATYKGVMGVNSESALTGVSKATYKGVFGANAESVLDVSATTTGGVALSAALSAFAESAMSISATKKANATGAFSSESPAVIVAKALLSAALGVLNSKS
jgi:hypothetical protein